MRLKTISKHSLTRYGIVGVLANLFGYLIYLAVTAIGLDPKLAIAILYPVGVAGSYVGHTRFSFAHQGPIAERIPQYLIAHAAGYCTNLLLMFVLHDRLLVPHEVTQAIAIVVVALLLFLLMRYFVFPRRNEIHKTP